jgi:phenylacetic acid degradation operon negative regulatory protein
VYYFEPLAPQDVSARALVLSLMSSAFHVPQSIARLIRAGELFGIEAATVRVAVTRLMKEGLLESPDRGVYRTGPKSRQLTRRVQAWKDVASRLVPWNGDWMVALTDHLGRTDRKQLRARERALALSGYQRTPAGFWVRPANLTGALADHRADLTAIGADEDIILLRAAGIAMEPLPDWPALWSSEALARSYEKAIAAMTASLARLPGLPPDAAARETLLIGQAVIRTINFDPLLPPELGNQQQFLQMVETMVRYNEAGRKCWQAYYAAEDAGTAD